MMADLQYPPAFPRAALVTSRTLPLLEVLGGGWGVGEDSEMKANTSILWGWGAGGARSGLSLRLNF